MRTAITLLIQELFRPRRPDPLEYLAPAEPVLNPMQTFDLLDEMGCDLWNAVRKGRTTDEALQFLAPRRRTARRWFR